ncbi:F-box protein CPR1-like [Coffea arabica]|uniref:F-box protein CPR1-like n=1 Tax=Coffea arabica TaxID=13443 RepID=A0A6P6WYV5_COFAR|nr:F-box protein CPR1-like [Coffea arabica]
MGQKLSNKRQKTTPQDDLQCTSSSTSDNGHLISSTLYRASSPGDDNLFNSCSNQDLDTLQRSVTSIPDDLMIEILSRLPVKSLLKFRCVSKSLLALMSSPDFIRTHVRKNNENINHRVICCVHCDEFGGSDLKEFPLKSALNEPVTRATDIDYPKGYDKIGSFKIVGSCNGLVCVTFPKKRSKNGELGILLWNPSMKKYRKLPKFDTKLNSTIWHSWFVACGYGYDESNDDYKVVAMLSVRYRQPEGVTMKEDTVTKMYSRKTHTWEEIENLKDGIPINELGNFASGRLHWLTSTTMPRRFHTKHNIHSYALVSETEGDLKIVSIDLESKMFGVVEYPEHEKSNSYCALGIAGGRLCLVRTYESRVMDISVMKEYGVKESWTKVASVNYPEHIVAKLYRQPFGWQNNGGHMLKLEKFLVLYDSEDDSIRFPIIGNFGLVRWVDTYAESLVLP